VPKKRGCHTLYENKKLKRGKTAAKIESIKVPT
jgi:hypothetical protein